MKRWSKGALVELFVSFIRKIALFCFDVTRKNHGEKIRRRILVLDGDTSLNEGEADTVWTGMVSVYSMCR